MTKYYISIVWYKLRGTYLVISSQAGKNEISDKNTLTLSVIGLRFGNLIDHSIECTADWPKICEATFVLECRDLSSRSSKRVSRGLEVSRRAFGQTKKINVVENNYESFSRGGQIPTIYTAAVIKTTVCRKKEKRVFNEDTKCPKGENMYGGEKKNEQNNNNMETVSIVDGGGRRWRNRSDRGRCIGLKEQKEFYTLLYILYICIYNINIYIFYYY